MYVGTVCQGKLYSLIVFVLTYFYTGTVLQLHWTFMTKSPKYCNSLTTAMGLGGNPGASTFWVGTYT